MKTVTIRDEFIKLGQVLKLAGAVDTGSEAKEVITEGLVKVNGETELRRGRKCVPGDRILYRGDEIEIR
ncbi:MAG: RNA-binding S4 domain-containing protein [Erysipelotrichaceae bacterium]|jgi:ribosome-associated protein|nr:RNA-binding S4 domain-containing protein [Erysipelotrichaceae bacterium]